jgi:hypothetical protein
MRFVSDVNTNKLLDIVISYYITKEDNMGVTTKKY